MLLFSVTWLVVMSNVPLNGVVFTVLSQKSPPFLVFSETFIRRCSHGNPFLYVDDRLICCIVILIS